MKEQKNRKYNSFFMGGFECADHINRSGHRVNLLRETQHDIRAKEDYLMLVNLGIRVVREGICWSAVEKSPFVFDFSEVKYRMLTAQKMGVQVIWDLCHFGYPDGLFPTHPLFLKRFMSLCRAFALFHQSITKEPLLVVPINEISFLSWHSGDVRGTVPFAINSGFDIKYHLCQALVEGIHVLRQTKTCQIFLVEPLIKIHPADDQITAAEMEELNSQQFQVMDIVSGKMCAELGGSPELYDIVGFNYYHSNQWNHRNTTIPWPDNKEALTPLSELLISASMRYNKPVVLTETGHFGEGRAQWIKEITEECLKAIAAGMDLRGICIYPVVDRPDWDELRTYHNSGIFDLDNNKNRIPYMKYLDAVLDCIQKIEVSTPIPNIQN